MKIQQLIEAKNLQRAQLLHLQQLVIGLYDNSDVQLNSSDKSCRVTIHSSQKAEVKVPVQLIMTLEEDEFGQSKHNDILVVNGQTSYVVRSMNDKPIWDSTDLQLVAQGYKSDIHIEDVDPNNIETALKLILEAEMNFRSFIEDNDPNADRWGFDEDEDDV